MLSFESDYTIGAHENILNRMQEMNLIQQKGYGGDVICESAKEKIRKACECPQAQIHFLTGGTQANATVIASVLERYEGVVAAHTGHVSTHEAGAIEYTGHKVLEIPGHDGKIKSSELKAYLETYWQDGNHEHMVFPGMVYISHPTEYGTLYSREELEEISGICREYDIAGAGEGKEQLIEVVEMQAAHIPGLVMVELQMKFDICHGLGPLVQDTHIIPRQENICKLFAKLLIDILQIL